MPTGKTIFQRTYENYITQISKVDFRFVEKRLGVSVLGEEITIPLFGEIYKVTEEGITDPAGEKPPFDICIVLCKYLLLCPEHAPTETGWISYRNFTDTGPLTTYFDKEVEGAIAGHFSGRLPELKDTGKSLGGDLPDIRASYDLTMHFNALPRVPLLMLFNDPDDEFPATCSILFKKCADRYLDGECLAMLGRLLFTFLKKPARSDAHRP